MALTDAQLADYRRGGYLIVPGMFPAEAMGRALAEVDLITYGKPYDQWAYSADMSTPSIADGISPAKAVARPQFPTGVPVLDKLIENADYLDAMEQLLGTPDLHYCNAHLFVRAGPNDKRHSAHPWEGFHIDHDTNTFLPPRDPVGEYDYLNTAILLHDILPDGAPMTVIPGSHHEVAKYWPEYYRGGLADSTNCIGDIRKIPRCCDADTYKSTVGAKGSVIFYSSYTLHAAVPFKNKSVQRSFWTLSVARRASQPWTGFAQPYRYGEREHYIPFWQQTTPRVRSIFGWPKPGHPYYTPQTLELLHGTFPKMDLRPYHDAIEH